MKKSLLVCALLMPFMVHAAEVCEKMEYAELKDMDTGELRALLINTDNNTAFYKGVGTREEFLNCRNEANKVRRVLARKEASISSGNVTK